MWSKLLNRNYNPCMYSRNHIFYYVNAYTVNMQLVVFRFMLLIQNVYLLRICSKFLCTMQLQILDLRRSIANLVLSLIEENGPMSTEVAMVVSFSYMKLLLTVLPNNYCKFKMIVSTFLPLKLVSFFIYFKCVYVLHWWYEWYDDMIWIVAYCRYITNACSNIWIVMWTEVNFWFFQLAILSLYILSYMTLWITPLLCDHIFLIERFVIFLTFMTAII